MIMKIYIIFPKRFFSVDQLERLNEYDLHFLDITKDKIDLDQMEKLYQKDDFIIAPDPTYLKDSWEAFPIERVKKMKGLKALCLTTTSFSWVDLPELAKLGVTVTNTPGKSTNAVAEFNIFMMYSLLRRMPLVIKNDWQMDYDKILNHEAKGLTAGIVGLGQIGNRVAQLCQGNEMEVIFYNRSQKDTPFKQVKIEELLEKSDVVFTTTAAAPELKGWLNKDKLSKMKSNSLIISTSDTHIMDVDYILEQVRNNKLGGFAFESDVNKYSEYEGNVMVFPEQAYFTQGTLENTAKILTDTILSVIEGKPINKVN